MRSSWPTTCAGFARTARNRPRRPILVQSRPAGAPLRTRSPCRPIQSRPHQHSFYRPALQSPLGTAINALYLAEERECVAGLLPLAQLPPELRTKVHDRAVGLIDAVRRNRTRKGGLDAFLKQYDLASREGVILMCLAEAL